MIHAYTASMQEAQARAVALRADFASERHLGSVRAASFRSERSDPALQADAYGYVQEFLGRVGG